MVGYMASYLVVAMQRCMKRLRHGRGWSLPVIHIDSADRSPRRPAPATTPLPPISAVVSLVPKKSFVFDAGLVSPQLINIRTWDPGLPASTGSA